jgi:hypothetical protein
MKASIFGLASFALFAVTSVLASPVAIDQTPALIERRGTVGLDNIVSVLITDVKSVNTNYNSTCASTCTQAQVVSINQLQPYIVLTFGTDELVS